MNRTCWLATTCCIIGLAAVALAAPGNPGLEFLDKVEADHAAGKLTTDQAVLYKFYYGFDQAKLPADYLPDSFSPLKNGTRIVAEFRQLRDKLSPNTVATIEGYLDRPNTTSGEKASLISPSGFFLLTYSTAGGDAVPTTDVDPANGIPDYVEKMAGYLDYSQNVECNTLGFETPPHVPYYNIYFESMGYYGYTSPIGTYGSSITLHNTYVGFPPNQDPEGNVWGAAKATIAHEFKHASQRAGSRWTEGGWVELDATWAEDAVYDYVNDYYNYLPSGSPISSPSTSLDSGGTGSYEDCVFQHWMTETWGNGIIEDLWNWRKTHTGESMLTSYNTMLVNYGSSLTAGWPVFAAWNYACGTAKSITGFGYGESRDYPSSPNLATFTTYPNNRSGTVNHLAAQFIRCILFSTDPGTVDVVFDGQNGSAITLTAIIKKTDGTGVLEHIALDGNNDAAVSLSVPREEISEVGFVMANSATGGGALTFDLTVDESDVIAVPGITLGTTSYTKEMEPDQTATETLEISSTGEAGSVLHFDVSVQATAPKAVAGGEKSIAGSTITSTTSDYTPGTTVALLFTLHNSSGDDEWITDAILDFPTGATVNSSSNFIGGSLGDLVTNGTTGNGVTVSWHGDTGSPNYYGVIKGGEYADATVNVTFDGGLSGTQEIRWTITGDGWGSTPHTVSASINLTMSGPTLTVTAPDGGEALAIGGGTTITWSSTGTLTDVKIDLSRNNGGVWESITASTPNDGSHAWTVTGPASDQCLVRVSSLDDSVSDASDGMFSIFMPVDWLTVSPVSGDIPEGSSQILDLDFDTAGMTPGPYQAYVIIAHDAPGSPSVVPVNLTVLDPVSSVDGEVPYVFSLEGNYPNPFNPLTTIAFTIPGDGAVTVDVVDVKGRLVKTVWQGRLQAGPHSFRWSGRDNAGQMVAAGTYFARLHMAGQVSTTKMVLAK